MSAVAAMLRRTRICWEVALTNGRVLGRFVGSGARQRALRFATALR
jgi:hypothetical protein